MMKMLFDAHLPRRLARLVADQGVDVRHTLSLADGNASSDELVIAVADLEQRIVVTKDSDFVDSYLLQQKPQRLLLISTGNIHNQALATLLLDYLPNIEQAFSDNTFVELSQQGLVVHG